MDDVHDYETAIMIADMAVNGLRDVCHRIEIAGSLRRKKDFVHDIDLVLWPICDLVQTAQPDFFGFGAQAMEYPTQLIDLMMQNGWLDQRPDAYRRKLTLAAVEDDDPYTISIELYLCEPNGSNFEALLQMRTGCAEFNVQLAQRAKRIGKIYRAGYGIYDAADPERRLDDGTEAGIFAALMLPYVEPERRTPQYVVGGRWPDGPAAIEV